MKVLLSAYACEPNKGSEAEVGWQRALHMLAFADEVWVLTRSNNQAVIEADPQSRTNGLHFIYYDAPQWALRLKRRRSFFPIYVVLWQWGSYRLAARYHREKRFDSVYHVTFASMQFGSFMGLLGIPFVIGPIAGGERAPLRLRRSMPVGAKVRELVRDLAILFQRFSPLARQSFAAAERIYVTTPDSVRIVAPKWHYKTEVHLAIATRGMAVQNVMRIISPNYRFVFTGRLLHWKGAHFAIRALSEAKRTIPEATLTLMGAGPDEQWLRDVARSCGVENAVEFSGYVPRNELINSLHSYTALVFPSIHDSGGFAVLEALREGLPVVCLDIGGPAIMVNESCGLVVPTANADEPQVITGIANAMIALATMSTTELRILSMGAIARANDLSWDSLTADIVKCPNRLLT
jgi:glycosyltransferase involved in cell wall biosynthesis